MKCNYRNCNIEFPDKSNKKFCCRKHKNYELTYIKNHKKRYEKYIKDIQNDLDIIKFIKSQY